MYVIYSEIVFLFPFSGSSGGEWWYIFGSESLPLTRLWYGIGGTLNLLSIETKLSFCNDYDFNVMPCAFGDGKGNAWRILA